MKNLTFADVVKEVGWTKALRLYGDLTLEDISVLDFRRCLYLLRRIKPDTQSTALLAERVQSEAHNFAMWEKIFQSSHEGSPLEAKAVARMAETAENHKQHLAAYKSLRLWWDLDKKSPLGTDQSALESELAGHLLEHARTKRLICAYLAHSCSGGILEQKCRSSIRQHGADWTLYELLDAFKADSVGSPLTDWMTALIKDKAKDVPHLAHVARMTHRIYNDRDARKLRRYAMSQMKKLANTASDWVRIAGEELTDEDKKAALEKAIELAKTKMDWTIIANNSARFIAIHSRALAVRDRLAWEGEHREP